MSIYDSLNPEQRKAVYQTEGPVLILAGAGSGKTRVLTHRVAFLIEEEGVNPWNIMAITFTNKAAGEMRDRIDSIVGYGSESVWISTFHSSCARILRRYADRIGYDTNFAIYDTDDSKSVIKEVAKKLNIDTKYLKEKAIMSAISSAKNELIGPEQYETTESFDFTKKQIAACYREYQSILRKNNAMDFDDLLFKCVELFKIDTEVLNSYQNRFKYICVDEYQDTNTAQFAFIRLLADKSHNICVVGDDDQSIYRFRGANIRNILDFERDYPEAVVIKLEQNYRSTSNVLNAANAVIRNNKGRKDKSLWTDRGDGDRIVFKQLDTAQEEAEFIAQDIEKRVGLGARYGDFAVLYRTNAQSRVLEERFIIQGTPYNVVGGINFYSRREIKDILSYIKTISNGQDDLAVKRIINIPKRGIGATSIQKVQDYADENGISFFEACRMADRISTLGRSAVKFAPFVNQIDVFRARAAEYEISQLFENILEETGYRDYLEEMDEEDSDDRMDNLDELKNKIIAYEESTDEPNLEDFLEEVALVADIDDLEENSDRVPFMTIHSAKGLEFKNVYLVGMEDGVFPGKMTLDSGDPEEMEEERRLAYVAITRAMEHLTITAARCRMLRGETQFNPISRFVREIPEELLDKPVPSKKKVFSFDSPEDAGFGTERTFGNRSVQSNDITHYKPYAKAAPKKTPVFAQPYILKSKTSLNENKKSMGEGLSYKEGDRVRHSRYGEGTVVEIIAKTKDFQVTVDFDSAGRKIMYAGFAKLEKL